MDKQMDVRQMSTQQIFDHLSRLIASIRGTESEQEQNNYLGVLDNFLSSLRQNGIDINEIYDEESEKHIYNGIEVHRKDGLHDLDVRIAEIFFKNGLSLETRIEKNGFTSILDSIISLSYAMEIEDTKAQNEMKRINSMIQYYSEINKTPKDILIEQFNSAIDKKDMKSIITPTSLFTHKPLEK